MHSCNSSTSEFLDAYLLFLKMADEQTKPPFNKKSSITKELSWRTLVSKDGAALEVHYRHILETLGKRERHNWCNI